jgi:hypothetical protein
MTTKAWLEGHPVDLAAVAALLPEGDVRVVRDADNEGRYYLTAPEIDNPPEPGRFDQPAEQLIGRINGLARARDTSYRPISLSGIVTDGNGNVTVFAQSARIEIRPGVAVVGVVTGPDGEPAAQPPSPWPDRLALAAVHSEAERVLVIMGRDESLDWIALYKVHEIIRRDIEPDKVHTLGWATKTQDSAFTASADRYDVSGNDARHAVDKRSGYPKHTMTISEGRAYIGNLVTSWLDSLHNP